MLGTDAAIDLGTSRTRIYLPQQGVVIDEPSVVAVDNMTEEIIAIGQEAYEMVGRTSQRLTVTYPLVNGVISNFILVEQMVGYFLKKVSSSMVFMPRVVACIPGEVTEVEKRAVVNSISTAGVRKICLIEEPIAAAMGAGIDIFTPHGSLVVDIGGGTTDTVSYTHLDVYKRQPMNYIFTVHVYGTPKDVVDAIMLPGIIPFNLIKGGANSLLAGILFKLLSPFVNRHKTMLG